MGDHPIIIAVPAYSHDPSHYRRFDTIREAIDALEHGLQEYRDSMTKPQLHASHTFVPDLQATKDDDQDWQATNDNDQYWASLSGAESNCVWTFGDLSSSEWSTTLPVQDVIDVLSWLNEHGDRPINVKMPATCEDEDMLKFATISEAIEKLNDINLSWAVMFQ